MGNLLFSPSGRIGPSEFMKGVIVLIVVALLLSLPGLLGLPKIVETLSSVLSLVTLWCWVVLWVKRYHDGGKSGWTCLLPIIVYIIVFFVVMAAIAGGSFMEMMELVTNGATDAEVEAFESVMMSKIGLPIIIASVVVSFAIAFLFNKTIKQDTHDNQFGPYGDVGNTFS